MNTEKKIICAIDSSSYILSVSVLNGDKLFCKETDAQMKHSEHVMPVIDNLIKQAALKPKHLQGVLCMSGPGSFTGLRIGYSITKGLALSLSIPFAALPTLDCVAYRFTKDSGCDTPILAVIEARKNAWFYAFYRDSVRLSPNKDGDSNQIEHEITQYNGNIILTGAGSALLYDSFSQEIKEKVTLKHENKGYSKELILMAQNKDILNNDCSNYLYSGPDYISCKDGVDNIYLSQRRKGAEDAEKKKL
ncbi:MAG: tRNA (adenosine(37)-N6)-threonylcarbamoyltransferase complex dimerization subunit type 1 TsaB [Treponema sp.]|jgi:tRNA threonylcarbamoyladenosine biosynthesis protein TsaB|nr:tRNA (adenosine(37)-N6)-threonylcarbamoyltransferase complex dimerization subunit type 1 TsaB [Treponema sp.]